MIESVKPPPKLKKKLLALPNKRKIGSWAETKAARHLENRGLILMGKNIQLGHQELDLVCWDQTDNELVFVEVKYRKNYEQGGAEVALSANKIRYLKLAIKKFVARYKIETNYRLDFVAITRSEISHFRNISF